MKKILVMQSDFGYADGAVAAMYGVALQIDEDLKIFDLTHEIPPYQIFEGSYRLLQSVQYWPKGTVFVSVVDPGVGTTRKSVVALTTDGNYIVTPNNGTLTHIHKEIGIIQMREIEENKHRRANTEASYTFHGRDVYASTGAKLAAGTIAFEDVGPLIPLDEIVMLPLIQTTFEKDAVSGSIEALDVRFGSLWTSIERAEFMELHPEFGERFLISIYHGDMLCYENLVLYGRSFADVRIGAAILYVNSLYRMGVAINQGSFARAYNISTGNQWKITLRKMTKES
ncbi:MAG: S-adenosyl-l-methionine hydroxide adenosyltransferase family protein [Erysipelotrichaceae bacterium]